MHATPLLGGPVVMIGLVLALQQLAQCAPNVAPETMAALVRIESSSNPYAIGVVGDSLTRQPRNKTEALAAVAELERQGKNFSMGLAQINRHNLARYGITYEQAFESCTNLRVGGQILEECYRRAMPQHDGPQAALRAALSCYYSGNFVRGFRPNKAGDPSYVEKIVAAAGKGTTPMVVPAIESIPGQSGLEPYVESSVLVSNEETQEPSAVVYEPVSDSAQPVRLRAVAAVEQEEPPAKPADRPEASAVVF